MRQLRPEAYFVTVRNFLTQRRQDLVWDEFDRKVKTSTTLVTTLDAMIKINSRILKHDSKKLITNKRQEFNIDIMKFYDSNKATLSFFYNLSNNSYLLPNF